MSAVRFPFFLLSFPYYEAVDHVFWVNLLPFRRLLVPLLCFLCMPSLVHLRLIVMLGLASSKFHHIHQTNISRLNPIVPRIVTNKHIYSYHAKGLQAQAVQYVPLISQSSRHFHFMFLVDKATLQLVTFIGCCHAFQFSTLQSFNDMNMINRFELLTFQCFWYFDHVVTVFKRLEHV